MLKKNNQQSTLTIKFILKSQVFEGEKNDK